MLTEPAIDLLWCCQQPWAIRDEAHRRAQFLGHMPPCPALRGPSRAASQMLHELVFKEIPKPEQVFWWPQKLEEGVVALHFRWCLVRPGTCSRPRVKPLRMITYPGTPIPQDKPHGDGTT